MNRTERLERLDTMLAEGRIIRKKWTDTDGHGREFACLLAALSPEAGKRGDASYCPSEVMPAWLAQLTPSLDDNVNIDYWPKMLQRYAALAHRWHVLDDADWRRAEYRVRAVCVREAMQHTDDERVLQCCRVSLSLCERVVDGDEPSSDAWAAARAAANAAAARDAASAAASAAAWAAARAANAAARDAARAAARAAAWAAADAAVNAAYAADATTWDRIAVAVFEAIEVEIERMK